MAWINLIKKKTFLSRNLEKESVYDVRVRAMNKFGMSNYSKVFNLYVKTARKFGQL